MSASDHIFLTASSDFSLICSKAESSLRKQGLAFIQNKTNDLVEYEVEKPSYFRVVIQRRTDADVGNFLMPSLKAAKGSFLDLYFSGDQDEFKSREATALAKLFLRDLAASLPEPPWEGLKFRESGRTKKKWKDILD